jgi:hypothetical protein
MAPPIATASCLNDMFQFVVATQGGVGFDHGHKIWRRHRCKVAYERKGCPPTRQKDTDGGRCCIVAASTQATFKVSPNLPRNSCTNAATSG